jgi:hypothetical protein
MANGLILHCGSEQTTLAQVLQVMPPQATETWNPVAYGDAIGFMRETARTRLGLEVKSESYGLNKAGSQLFARITLDTGDTEKGLSIGLRQSYDKSLALGVAVGANVFVCDNLCFSGDAFKVVRKNTMNVWPDFQRLVTEQVLTALDCYETLSKQTLAMKAKPCHKDRGYALLGVAMGKGLLTPHQASVAFGDWETPRHEEFSDRNIWGLYNAVTEGLKKGAPATVLDRHAKAHDYFVTLTN